MQNSFDEKCRKMKAKEDEINTKLEDTLHILSNKEVEAIKQQEKSDALQREMEHAVENLKRDLGNSRKQRDLLVDRADDLDAEVDDLQEQMGDLRESLKVGRETILELRTEVATLREQQAHRAPVTTSTPSTLRPPSIVIESPTSQGPISPSRHTPLSIESTVSKSPSPRRRSSARSPSTRSPSTRSSSPSKDRRRSSRHSTTGSSPSLGRDSVILTQLQKSGKTNLTSNEGVFRRLSNKLSSSVNLNQEPSAAPIDLPEVTEASPEEEMATPPGVSRSVPEQQKVATPPPREMLEMGTNGIVVPRQVEEEVQRR